MCFIMRRKRPSVSAVGNDRFCSSLGLEPVKLQCDPPHLPLLLRLTVCRLLPLLLVSFVCLSVLKQHHSFYNSETRTTEMFFYRRIGSCASLNLGETLDKNGCVTL
ncbi:hypothetical protein CesoFtcFv8_003104 [Champsocephalus esox]|uniref:Uncharacterized protein n=2 Tax=Champsocephalus esox TaxID=159716 RepID=A0AAN8CT59_9TELE|nr:hypothetical protein CesoFtcFv8_003104 [Champsocephalus esox]